MQPLRLLQILRALKTADLKVGLYRRKLNGRPEVGRYRVEFVEAGL
jgi:hypothetical protein